MTTVWRSLSLLGPVMGQKAESYVYGYHWMGVREAHHHTRRPRPNSGWYPNFLILAFINSTARYICDVGGAIALYQRVEITLVSPLCVYSRGRNNSLLPMTLSLLLLTSTMFPVTRLTTSFCRRPLHEPLQIHIIRYCLNASSSRWRPLAHLTIPDQYISCYPCPFVLSLSCFSSHRGAYAFLGRTPSSPVEG